MNDLVPEKNIRSSFGTIAGLCYTVGNVALTFRGVIQTAFEENKLDLGQMITEDPMLAAGGAVLTLSSVVMWTSGKNRKGMAASSGLGAVGHMIIGAYNFGLGPVVGFIGSSYGAYQNMKPEKKADEKFPMALPGSLNLGSHLSYLASDLGKSDTLLSVKTGIDMLWIVGSSFLTLSKPKKETPKPV